MVIQKKMHRETKRILLSEGEKRNSSKNNNKYIYKKEKKPHKSISQLSNAIKKGFNVFKKEWKINYCLHLDTGGMKERGNGNINSWYTV
jgi:16S rRNA C1402 N4-methylase RsmH